MLKTNFFLNDSHVLSIWVTTSTHGFVYIEESHEADSEALATAIRSPEPAG